MFWFENRSRWMDACLGRGHGPGLRESTLGCDMDILMMWCDSRCCGDVSKVFGGGSGERCQLAQRRLLFHTYEQCMMQSAWINRAHQYCKIQFSD
jgi:hypothetical protein